MRKKSTNSNLDKEEKNYQTGFYPERPDDEPLYNALQKLRESLSNEFPDETNELTLTPVFLEEEDELVLKSPDKGIQGDSTKSVLKDKMVHQHTGGLLEDKLNILKNEIEDINRNIKGREEIEEKFNDSIDTEIKALCRDLYELPSWQRGSKEHLAFIKLELFRQLCSLKREKRQSSLGFWKDTVFEKRDRRNLLLEYKSLKSMNDLEQED